MVSSCEGEGNEGLWRYSVRGASMDREVLGV
jgi:hypothetical protein